MKPRNQFLSAAGLLIAAALLQSCALAPNSLVEARSQVASAERDGVTAQYAPTQLADARDQLNSAERAFNERKGRTTIDHEANQAQRMAQIAVEQGKVGKAQSDIAQSEAERQKLLVNRLQNLADRATLASEKAEADQSWQAEIAHHPGRIRHQTG